MTGAYAHRRDHFPLRAWRVLVTIVAFVLLGIPFLLGSPVLTLEWFSGDGPRWWRRLRIEP